MSLYIFGRVDCDPLSMEACESSLSKLCSRLDIALSVDAMDNEDRKVLAEAMASKDLDGLYFALHSGDKESDATALWLETRELALRLLSNEGIDGLKLSTSDLEQIELPKSYFDAILSSRLGSFICGVSKIFESMSFGLAFFDGAIETVRDCEEKNACLRSILRSFILPWDCLENALYVFHKISANAVGDSSQG